jgi:hypothetical protein
MLFTSEQLTNRLEQLFHEGRQYWDLQKQYLSLHAAEVLTRLLSTVVLLIVLILVGSMVLLFGSFAVAYWLGELLDSTLLGFAIIAGLLLVISLLVYANRKSWIYIPITRFVVGLLVSSLPSPSQEAVAMEKVHLREKLDENEREIKNTASTLLAPAAPAKNKWGNASNLLQHGLMIYRGVQIGVSIVGALRRVFRVK